MAARLAATVLVRDPETHQTVELAKGTSPEPRLAALVTNPMAWEGGKVPAAVRKANEAPDSQGEAAGNGSGGTATPTDGPESEPAGSDDTSSAEPAEETTTDEPAEPELDEPAEPAEPEPATKTPAKKAASSRPSRRGTAAAEGTGGQ